MILPNGVFHRPRQNDLIAKDADAMIRIDTGPTYPGNQDYDIRNRTFHEHIAPFMHGDWAALDELTHCRKNGSEALYSRAEHQGLPKKPNITVLPNFAIVATKEQTRPPKIFGSTMGHFHPPSPDVPPIQEIYEFQSFGLLVLDRGPRQIEIWVASDGDKVSVPNGCHVTLYNIGDDDHPLITLDYANPDKNPTNEDLSRICGPILLACYDHLEVVFTLNGDYINNADYDPGIRLSDTPMERRERQIKISRAGRLELGAFLHEQLTGNPDVIGQFAKLGLRIRKATPQAFLDPVCPDGSSRLYFISPLATMAERGSGLQRRMFGSSVPSGPGPSDYIGMVNRENQRAREKQKRAAHPPTETRPVIVVEGAGDWVTKAYRSVFELIVSSGKKVSVFYADDTRWRPRPGWTENLKDWETYLDKTVPDDLRLYQGLIPDVVFIVTPDFTHCAIARQWTDRRVPLVFIEKPFDSQTANVDLLLNELGRKPVTAVLGLDHYQFRALQLHDRMPEIARHLGGAIANVVFYLTEAIPVETERIPTLQFGLTIDLLPHLLALLAYFGSVESIDEIEILDAGHYTGVPDEFRNETYSRVRFTFEDYSGNRHRVPCLATVGKGFQKQVKYLEVTGSSGNAIRIDFLRKPQPCPSPNYPYGSVLFLVEHQSLSKGEARTVYLADPYDPDRILHLCSEPKIKLEEAATQYQKLIENVFRGTSEQMSSVLGSTLLIPEARHVVQALDRIWWAIQDFKTTRRRWSQHTLQQLDPIKFAQAISIKEN